eukprot:7335037-Lingulodinium_polyedra.AAC.1
MQTARFASTTMTRTHIRVSRAQNARFRKDAALCCCPTRRHPPRLPRVPSRDPVNLTERRTD